MRQHSHAISKNTYFRLRVFFMLLRQIYILKKLISWLDSQSGTECVWLPGFASNIKSLSQQFVKYTSKSIQIELLYLLWEGPSLSGKRGGVRGFFIKFII